MFLLQKSIKIGFRRVGNTPIIPISVKVLSIFVALILLTSLSTNFISLQFSQRQVISLTNNLLVYDLSDICETASNQYQISMYTQDKEQAILSLQKMAEGKLSRPHSVAMGLNTDGTFLFLAYKGETSDWQTFSDSVALTFLQDSLATAISENSKDRLEGSIRFKSQSGEYMGVYKYQTDWNCFILRGELRSVLQKDMYYAFLFVFIIILALTIVFIFLGMFVLNKMFSNIKHFTKTLYDLQQEGNKFPSADTLTKGPIDISDASNDDITYLAANFNNLYVNTASLRNMFQKFVPKSVVDTAYKEHKVELKGEQRELTILFTDIQNFTTRTEILGNDIIRLLNIHYNSIIGIIQPSDEENELFSKAFIGSIIGDAILGVFGKTSGAHEHDAYKSVDALSCAWKMSSCTKEFCKKIDAKRDELIAQGKFTDKEKEIYEAVRIEIGVGIDGGSVFYGNIGSHQYMANTVIGDNVNSASRIESLTRIYKLPVLVSEYVKNEVRSIPEAASRYTFYEIDTVQVKGKNVGKKIFFPLDLKQEDKEFCEMYTEEKFMFFQEGLTSYYEGDWSAARMAFERCQLQVANVFLERMGNNSRAPENWSGIWTMTTK